MPCWGRTPSPRAALDGGSSSSDGSRHPHDTDEPDDAEGLSVLAGVRNTGFGGYSAAPSSSDLRKRSLRDSVREPSWNISGGAKLSVVAPYLHEPKDKQLKPVDDRAMKAAAFVFRACNTTRTGALTRWEFASAIEMMMRQKLVPYLIDQVHSSLHPFFVSSPLGAAMCHYQHGHRHRR